MADQEVMDRLANYGTWIQHETGLGLSRPGPGTEPTEVAVEPLAQARASTGRRDRILVLSALAVFVLAALALAGALRDRSAETVNVAASPEDPPGPLFVLPGPEAGYSLAQGSLDQVELPPDQRSTQVLVVGVGDNGTYKDVATVRVGPEPTRDHGDWQVIEWLTGPAELATDESLTRIVQQQRGVWLVVWAAADRVDFATQVLLSLEIDGDGLMQLGQDTGLVLLDDDRSPPSRLSGTSLTMLDVASSPDGISVETAASTTPLMGAIFSDQASRIRLGDRDGWRVTRLDPQGEWNGVAWQATPSRIVAVSGVAPLKTILEVAESLTIVNKATWEAALPD